MVTYQLEHSFGDISLYAATSTVYTHAGSLPISLTGLNMVLVSSRDPSMTCIIVLPARSSETTPNKSACRRVTAGAGGYHDALLVSTPTAYQPGE